MSDWPPDMNCPEHPSHAMRGCLRCREVYPCPKGSSECRCPDFDHRQLLFQVEAAGATPITFHAPTDRIFRAAAEKDLFLILSLKWSKGGILTWWGPDNSGYVTDIDNAGRYTRAQVEGKARYYSNEDSTRAVPVQDVYAGVVGKVRKVVEGYVLNTNVSMDEEE